PQAVGSHRRRRRSRRGLVGRLLAPGFPSLVLLPVPRRHRRFARLARLLAAAAVTAVGGDRPARLHRPAAGLPGAGALACPPAALLVGGAHQRPSSAQRCRSSAISSSSEGYPNGFGTRGPSGTRSEEHTSELQSREKL